MNLTDLLKQSLEEDIGAGDVTCLNLDLDREEVQAFLIAKQEAVLAGLDVAFQVFRLVDPDVRTLAYRRDGDRIHPGDEIAKITGMKSSILQAERVALNFLQRLSGTATLTRQFVDLLEGTGTRLLDTRKTTPLLRSLQKYAVRMGGGFNHRNGLYDMIMLKENHIRSVGSITESVARIKKNNVTHRIEVEATCLDELDEAVACGVDRVMLDNMSLEDMRVAVERHGDRIELEASGNVRLETVEAIAATGVHFISTGAVTHSAKSVDISLLFKE